MLVFGGSQYPSKYGRFANTFYYYLLYYYYIINKVLGFFKLIAWHWHWHFFSISFFCLSHFLSVCLFVCLYACLCLYVCAYVCMYVCMSASLLSYYAEICHLRFFSFSYTSRWSNAEYDNASTRLDRHSQWRWSKLFPGDGMPSYVTANQAPIKESDLPGWGW